MTPKRSTDEYPPSEATRRRDDALRAALTMPARTHAESSPKRSKAAAGGRSQSPKKSGKRRLSLSTSPPLVSLIIGEAFTGNSP